MASINIRLEIKSSGLMSSPVRIVESDNIIATGVVTRIAKLITAVDGSSATLFEKADFIEADNQAMVLIKNTGVTHDLFVEAGSNVEFMKLKPGQFAMFPWFTDSSAGQDIKVYASNAAGTTVEGTLIELT